MNLKDLQKEVGEWHDAKFGPVDPALILGVITEELGELARAEVKSQQRAMGITDSRYDSLDWEAGKQDALGDIVIACCGYASRSGIDINEAVERAWSIVKQR